MSPLNVEVYPVLTRLKEVLDTLNVISDPEERASLLIDYAARFREVPREIAQRPFSANNRVPYCESDAYVWVVEQPDHTLKLYFAVENPSGISAKALAVILDKTLSGLPPEEFAEIPPDIVERIFRRNISMGKGMGLVSIVETIQRLAEQHARARRASA
jgi:cysteine desulfuration protein SufE